MKSKIIYIHILLLCTIYINGQNAIPDNLILNNPHISQTYNYKANKAIYLQSGFNYAATNTNSFNASIDPLNLQPDPYPNNILGGTDNGIVGKIDDNFDITSLGQVSYNIPIKVPGGTGGVVPMLSIAYNSSTQEGLLGVGFDLAGLSMINRAPANMITDGTVGCVNFSETDKFMLDGMRLIQIKSINDTTYEFRTERNSFTKIIASGINIKKGDPSFFTAYTKEGLIYEYGSNKSTLKSISNNNASLFWLLRKVSDTKGNYFEIKYERDDLNGEYWPIKIEYTGNKKAGLSPYNTIQFEYETNPYPSIFYISGMKIQKSKILKSINIYSGKKKVRGYDFNYEKDLESYLLSTVTEISSDGTKLNPTKFTWNKENQPLKQINERSGNSGIPGFFTGNGLLGRILIDERGRNTGREPNDGKQGKYGITGVKDRFDRILEIMPADFNGDGYDDLIIKADNDIFYYTNDRLQNKISFSYHSKFRWSHAGGGESWININADCIIGDFNGDGISDLLIISDNYYYECYFGSKNNIFKNRGYYPNNHFLEKRNYIQVIDFNGDGISDIIALNDKGCEILLFSSDGNFTRKIIKTDYLKNYSDRDLYFADINGDGKTDIISVRKKYTRYEAKEVAGRIFYSTGIDYVKSNKSFIDHRYNSIKLLFNDLNKDGKADLILVQKGMDSKTYTCIDLNTNGEFHFVQKFESPDLDNYNYSAEDSYLSGNVKIYIDKKDRRYYGGRGRGRNGVHTLRDGTIRDDREPEESEVDIMRGGNYEIPIKENHLLSNIIDGLGNSTKIDYSLLFIGKAKAESGRTRQTTESKSEETHYVYEQDYKNQYPLISSRAPYYIVEKVSQSNGIGGKNVVGYKYKNLLIHKLGRGILGFEYFIATDSTNNTKTVRHFEVNREQYTTAEKSVETYVNDILLSKVENINSLKYFNTSIGKKIFTYDITSSREYKYDINTKKLFSEVESTFEYDDYGNATKAVTKYGSAESVTNINTYTNNEEKWHLGRLTKSVVIKTNNKGSVSNTSTFEYDPESGILNKETFEPDDNKIGYTKIYDHDLYGNIVKSTVKANNALYKARITESKYDSKGRFEIETINNINNQKWGIKRTINEDLGLVLNETDANGLKTEYIYDSFGQIIFTKTPLGNTQNVYRWSNGHVDAPTNAKFFTLTDESGKQPVIEFFDMLGRSLRTVVIGFDGRKIYSDVVYNAKGQIEKSSEPYFAGQIIYWNKSEYDALGRTTKQIYTDNTYSEFKYDGFTTTTISPIGHKDTKIIDIQGRIIKSIDNNGGEITYEYDPAGNCTKVIGPRTTISTSYDRAGNRIKLVDPDLGTTEYEYSSYGELVMQKDSKGTKTFTYDELGRLIKETAPDRITTYSYDSQKKGLVDRITLDNNNISQSFIYDNYGRTISTTETIDDKKYTTHTTYDIYNRNDVITYPSGFKIKHEYNSNGYLAKVKEVESGKVHWQAKITNAKGQIEQFTLGNNLTTTIKYNAAKGYITDIVTPGIQNWSYKFNNVGNLTERTDNNKRLIEKFDYDGLNRLTKVYYNGTLKQEMTYDAAGNITSKTGVGTTFKYENNTNKLLSVSGGGYNPPSWDVINYTSFNKISYISQGANSLALVYGVGKERKKSVTTKNGITETKYYAGSLYEEQYISNGENKKIHYIFANGGMIAIYEQSNKNGNKLCYVHKDHLGSVQAYTNEQGALIGEMSYDAWGRRRNPVNWEYYTNLVDANAWHPRGFTGHEHLDIFEMINMNGRMYDPILGRFLSPDPFVQAPDYTQGLNRYVYCVNNPLSLVDPSGYSWFSKNWKSLTAAVVGITVACLTGGTATPLVTPIIAGALGGMASGVTFAVLNGANNMGIAKSAIQGGLWGGVSAGTANGIGTVVEKIPGKYQFIAKLSLHSSSQALIEGAKGGNIKHGFFSGAASALGGFAISKYGNNWGMAGKVAVNAVIGGTASQIGGGKFANGAITGAYSMLFNELMHPDDDFEQIKSILKSATNNSIELTRKIANLILNGDVAISVSISYQISIFAHIQHEIVGPYIFILKGPNQMSPEQIMHTLNEATYGIGGLDISVSFNFTSFKYTGSLEQLSIDTFRGYSISAGFGIKAVGISGSISFPDKYNDFLIGTTGSIAIGIGDISAYLGITNTTY